MPSPTSRFVSVNLSTLLANQLTRDRPRKRRRRDSLRRMERRRNSPVLLLKANSQLLHSLLLTATCTATWWLVLPAQRKLLCRVTASGVHSSSNNSSSSNSNSNSRIKQHSRLLSHLTVCQRHNRLASLLSKSRLSNHFSTVQPRQDFNSNRSSLRSSKAHFRQTSNSTTLLTTTTITITITIMPPQPRRRMLLRRIMAICLVFLTTRSRNLPRFSTNARGRRPVQSPRQVIVDPVSQVSVDLGQRRRRMP